MNSHRCVPGWPLFGRCPLPLVAVVLALASAPAAAELPEASVADVLGEADDLPVPPVPFDLDTAFAQIRDPAI